MAHRAGLPGEPAAGNSADDVILACTIGRDDRLLDQHAQHRTREENFDGARVYHDFSGAGLDPDARDGVLALAGRVGAALLVELLHVFRRFGRGWFEAAELFERLHGSGHVQALAFLRFMAATSSISGCCAACG